MNKRNGLNGLVCFLLAVLCGGLGGCDVISAFAASGMNMSPAKFELNTVDAARRMEGKTLVMVDDLYQSFDQSNAVYEIGQQVENLLVKNDVLARDKFVKQRFLSHLVGDLGPREFGKLSVLEVGRRLKASQVIYVSLKEVTLNDGYGVKPRAIVVVKVIDVFNGKKIFPSAIANETTGLSEVSGLRGYPMKVEMFSSPATDIKTRKKVKIMLMGKIGRKVAELFYEHEETVFDDK